ncbi:MAG: prevent-host-death protein, partial [Lentisphaeria bacterium]|nr:prevent-host-death protein [Lentisphaeria bacterium]
VVITQNGEATVIVEDIREYEKTQESLAMLKIIAMGERNIQNNETKSFKEAFRDIRKLTEVKKKAKS